MSNVSFYLKNDYKGACLLAVNNLRRKITRLSSNFIMTLKMRCIGVKYGKNNRWGGITYIERFPLSNISIGNNCCFNSSSLYNQRGIRKCILHTGTCEAKIVIGNSCGFSGVSIVADKEVKIENNVVVGANTKIGDRDDHSDILHTQPSKILIKDNVFIGMNCTIMKGVTIGENSIIGAGSIVTKDIPSNCIAAGIPCRIIKKIQ